MRWCLMLDNSKYKQSYSIKVKSLIKFHRKGSLFSFVKASKYYLSSLLKLSVYKLISDNLKISKWEQKHKERYDNLQHAIQQYKFIKQAILQSQIWLNSTEFQEKYIDTKHPYPPLLDPSAVDYESISAELAYELNLPLPPKYDLIIISGSNMGHNALLDFLEKCGAKRGQDHLPKNLKTIYTSFYNFLVNPANASDFKILPFVQYDYLDYTEVEFRRYCDFFSRKVPILVQVRDPFIKLLLVNNIDFQANKTRFFTLNDNLPAVLDMFEYVYDLNLQKALNYLVAPHILRQSTAIKGIEKTQIDFIDTDNELMPNNAYETTKKLAQRYKLIEPKDKTFFEGIMEEDIEGFLPLTLNLFKSDAYLYLNKEYNKDSSNIKIDILIVLYQYMSETNKENFIDISNEIWGSNWLYKGSDIRLYINKDEYKIFDKTMKQATIKYFEYFKHEFMKRVELEISRRFVSADILDYLKKDKALRQKLKDILDTELECLKQMRPDIIESWTYYKEFETLCKDL